MTNMNDKEERKLKKVKIALMRQPQFALWSGIMMVGETKISDEVPTACTDGRNEMYGRGFVKMLPEPELAFVIMHETLHKAFRHLTTWKRLHEDNAQLANMACDYVINLMLVEMDPNERHLAMPKMDGKAIGLLDKRFANMNTKQVFDILKQEQKNGGKGSGKGSGKGKGQPGQPGQPGNGEGEGFDEHDWSGANAPSQQEQEALAREIDNALRQGQIAQAKAQGKAGGNIDRALQELLEPQVDWREVLREFVTSTCANKDTSSWRRVNRRFIGSDIYMPSLIGERVGRLAIGIDTSGSIGIKELSNFLSEVKAVVETVRPEAIDLIYWDSRVASHEHYDMGSLDNLIQSTKPKGGGGTDPTCMMDYLKKENIKPEAIIMLTDGEIGSWGNAWESPILWVICNSYRQSNIMAPVGKTIHIKEQ